MSPDHDAIAHGSDAALATRVAVAAGRVLMQVRESGLFDGSDLGDAGDRVAHHFIVSALSANRPADAVLSEEGKGRDESDAGKRLWIVDPLDGTREYSEGRDDFAVHIALTADGSPTACAVSLPALDAVYSTDAPVAVPPRGQGPLRIAVSRSRAPQLSAAVAERTGAELVPLGSAGRKVMAVVRGEADAYLHAGGQYEWDSAAPVGVAIACGLHATRLNGEPLIYGKADPWQPDLLVCRPELAEQLLAEVSRTRR